MEEMISKRDLIEIFAWCERELKEMMNDIPNAEGTIDLVFWTLDKMLFPQERKWKEINGGD